MARRLPRLARLACACSMLLVAAGSTPAVHSSTSESATARGYYPEVRLRKLHLVRPDLIPYPIYFDVYC